MERVCDLISRAAGNGGQAERLEAFGKLVELFQDMAYGYAYSILGDFHLAEDAAQNAFITAFQRLDTLQESAAFPGWFRRIVQTTCTGMTRGKQLPAVSLEAAGCVRAAADDPATAAERAEMRDEVLKAIRQLPTTQREVTTLFYINGYSQSDIADFLEVPVSTVKNRLMTSRRQLKERMLNMVKYTLRQNAPDPEVVRDRTEFLLHLSRMINEGQTIKTCLEVCRERAKTSVIRDAIADITTTVYKDAKTLSDGMRKHLDLFPISVVALVEDGERFGVLEKTLPWACQWISTGRYEPDDRYMFQRCMWQHKVIEEGLARGASKLLIRNRQSYRPSKDRQESGPPWAELAFLDGHTESFEPSMGHIANGVYFGLKGATILDGRQEGVFQTGILRIRPQAEDKDEKSFRIIFDPTAGLGEAQIDLTPVSPDLEGK